MVNKDKDKNLELGARILTVIGVAMVLIAIVTPFIIFHLQPTYLADLGPVGDFIGGTTVTFLTGASVFLLIATNRMQRKELQMSRQSIDEMVKQTEASVEQMKASVQQAKEAKIEAQITNGTMKRQQFETTFFNMITLHNNNTDKLRNKDFKGNEVIKDALDNFSDYYGDLVSSKFKKSYLTDDYEEVADLIKYLQMHGFKEVKSVQTSIKAEVVDAFEKLDFRELIKAKVEKGIIKEFQSFAYQRADENLISYAYYEFEINHDSILSSYFNSITTIIKFLSESEFEKEDKQNGTLNNNIYREILFSQFSPHEMMMIYYFAKYSSSNEWLLEELKTYNLFYPRLGETIYLFWSVDNKNINELQNNSGITNK
ncbi:putative phage abortive infection protein [Bacillus toyonensis]|uniref:putative phage abortive infection protein n=1 Tax=Bacillus toyonensis TaxID=155322 RepID=UPI003D303A77